VRLPPVLPVTSGGTSGLQCVLCSAGTPAPWEACADSLVCGGGCCSLPGVSWLRGVEGGVCASSAVGGGLVELEVPWMCL
jgi:hypothetical protein